MLFDFVVGAIIGEGAVQGKRKTSCLSDHGFHDTRR
jgi:hypothetical protein